MPKVTVFLTSYNHEKNLPQSIESILNQTFSDFELIIMDDCSTDGSWGIIQGYEKQDRRIRTIRHEYNWSHSGLANEYSSFKGEYLAIAHSDDFWSEDKLEKQVKYLDEHNDIGACFTWVNLVDDEGKVFEDRKHFYYGVFDRENRSRFEWLKFFFDLGNCLCHPSVLIRTKAYVEYNMFPKGLSSLPDLFLWIRLCFNTEIYVMQERLTFFRIHGDEGNTSGDTYANNVTKLTEEFCVLDEYFLNVNECNILQIFPQASRFLKDGEINVKFALAMMCMEGPRKPYYLKGIEILYLLFQDAECEKEMRNRYGFDRKAYKELKAKIDIFNCIPEERYLNVNLFYNSKNESAHNIMSVLTGKFYIKNNNRTKIVFDLNGLDETILKDGLRIVLDVGRYRKIRILDSKNGDRAINFSSINGEKEDTWDVFFTLLPQYFTNEHVECSNLFIDVEVEILDLFQVEEHFHKMDVERRQVHMELNAIKSQKAYVLYKKIKSFLGK
ncbi:glycosyltransferase involved in cell wall biosynthesis [Lachnospiraceae bacterium PFB1-21]